MIFDSFTKNSGSRGKQKVSQKQSASTKAPAMVATLASKSMGRPVSNRKSKVE